ncbi:MAG: N-acetylmuramoyl-L-alanine amidase [Candidatus Berkelbacteria bacterium]|nr:N-acetylmuramoyl-L-alanine amidase [Candidatus Berkelbacteria bacterium]
MFIATFLALFLVLFVSVKYATSAENETKAKNIEIQNFDANSAAVSGLTAQIDAQRLEANSLSGQNYQWQSQIIHADFSFDALGANWSKDDQSKIDLYARFSKDNKSWEDWQKFDPTDEGEANEKSPSVNSNTEEVANLLFSKDAQYFQYKVVFADKKNDSFLESIKFVYIKPSNNSNKKFSLLNYLGIKKAEAVNSPRIISRAEWGADPALMTWPPEYVRPNKIIIHHTASGNNPPDPAAVVRSIYYYHAVSLGWGDIGYNYLFDQYGNIYEGRAGGNMVVGAHAYGQNYGSIGFSVIGEFSGTNITDATFNSLVDLTAFKAYANDFDITWGTIFGHRDFCNNPPGHNCTACPGDVLYGYKGQIIDIARQKENTYLQRDRDFLNQNNNVLVKSYSQPEVYLWKDGVKRHIVDMQTFAILGYSSSNINYVSSIALNEKPSGPFLSALIKANDNPKVYLAADNFTAKYFIDSGNIFNHYGFSWSNIASFDPAQVDSITLKGTLKRNVQKDNDPAVYRITANTKYHYYNMLSFAGWGNTSNDISTLPSAFVDIYPRGSDLYWVVKGSGPQVYFLQDGQKHYIPSMEIFSAWNQTWSMLTNITDSELNSFFLGSNLSRFVRGSQIYLLDEKGKHLISSVSLLSQWGQSESSTFLTYDEHLARINNSFDANDLIKGDRTAEVYLLFQGKKYHIADEPSLFAWNKKWGDLKVYSQSLINEIPTAETKLSRFIQKLSTPQDPAIYLVLNGEKRYIPSPTIWTLWGGATSYLAKLPSDFFDSLPPGAVISPLIKGTGPAIYILDNGRKDWVPSPEVLQVWGWSLTDVVTVDDSTLNNFPVGPTLGVLVRSTTNPGVYLINSGKKLYIPSSAILYAWGFNFNQIIAISPTLLQIPGNGDTLGILAKSSDADPNIFLMNQTERKLIPDIETLNAWQGTSNIVASSYINNLPINGSAGRVAKGANSVAVYFLDSGKKYHFPDWDTFIVWGYNNSNITVVNQETINAVPYAGIISRLIKGSGPAIYLIDGGQKRYIPSPDIFNSYGWSWSSIITLADSFINQLHDGPVVLPAEIDALDGVWIPTTSGKTGREQHLWLESGETPEHHYLVSGTPPWAMNGMAGSFGAFGSPPTLDNERYYINMRWNYTEWYEAPDGTCHTPDGHPDTCYRNSNLALKTWHRSKRLIVTNPANGHKIVVSVEETGPAIWTGRVSGLSPEAMGMLGANTNDNLIYHWSGLQSVPLGPLNF